MKQAISTKIIYICLFLLAILPIFNPFNLTWKEVVYHYVGIAISLCQIFYRATPQTQGREEGRTTLDLILLNSLRWRRYIRRRKVLNYV